MRWNVQLVPTSSVLFSMLRVPPKGIGSLCIAGQQQWYEWYMKMLWLSRDWTPSQKCCSCRLLSASNTHHADLRHHWWWWLLSVRLLLIRSFSIKCGRYTFQPFTVTILITTQVLAHQPQTIVWRTYISIDQTPGDAFEGSFDDSYAHEGSRLNDEVESGTMWCSFVVSSY